jgi:hypothetical protein
MGAVEETKETSLSWRIRQVAWRLRGAPTQFLPGIPRSISNYHYSQKKSNYHHAWVALVYLIVPKEEDEYDVSLVGWMA